MSSAKTPTDEVANNFETTSNSTHAMKDTANAKTNGNGLDSVTNVSNGSSVGDIDDDDRDRVSDSEEEFFECSQELFPTSARKLLNKPSTPLKTSPTKISNDNSASMQQQPQPEEIEVVDLPSSNESVKECSTPPKKLEQSIMNETSTSPTINKGIKTATDDGFIEDFFGRSRLHLISDQKKEMQVLIGNLRKNIDAHTFSNLQKFEAEIEAINIETGSGLSFTNDEGISEQFISLVLVMKISLKYTILVAFFNLLY